MAFLDNTGDIILDAVLTDEGRRRLAKGDGSFKIVKFALGDDEIDYSLYNANNPSGSAYYDLDILRTPVLEAFTNNIASLNSRLLTLPRTNLLFLPVIKLNGSQGAWQPISSTITAYANTYFVAVDNGKIDSSSTQTNTTNYKFSGNDAGVIKSTNKNYIKLEQGLDTTKLSFTQPLDADLVETEYNIIIDNRLGSLIDKQGVQLNYASIDDDQYATYNVSLDVDKNVVSLNTNRVDSSGTRGQVLAGPRGSILEFSIRPNIQLVSGDYLFDLIGTSVAAGTTFGSTSAAFKLIKTNVTVVGVNTGYQIDVPVYFIKEV